MALECIIWVSRLTINKTSLQILKLPFLYFLLVIEIIFCVKIITLLLNLDLMSMF